MAEADTVATATVNICICNFMRRSLFLKMKQQENEYFAQSLIECYIENPRQ